MSEPALVPGESGVVQAKLSRVQFGRGGRAEAARLTSRDGESFVVFFGPGSVARDYDWQSGTWYSLGGVQCVDPWAQRVDRTQRVSVALSEYDLPSESAADRCPECDGATEVYGYVELDHWTQSVVADRNGRVFVMTDGQGLSWVRPLDSPCDNLGATVSNISVSCKRRDVVCQFYGRNVTEYYRRLLNDTTAAEVSG